MLKILMYKIFDRTFLSEFTWTGKSIAKRAKIPFKNFKNTNDFLFETVNTIDGGYAQSSFLDNLKNKVLKYAYGCVFHTFICDSVINYCVHLNYHFIYKVLEMKIPKKRKTEKVTSQQRKRQKLKKWNQPPTNQSLRNQSLKSQPLRS